MYKIHVYDPTAIKLFSYESDILPVIGDVYAGPNGSTFHYEVTKRLLHTDKDMTHVLSIWAKKTN